MSHRPWLGLVAVAAMLVGGCSAPPPPPSSPDGKTAPPPHACLEIWGQAATGLRNVLIPLNRPTGEGGLGHAWALHAKAPAVYESLVRLKVSLETALGGDTTPTINQIDLTITVSPSIATTADVVRTQLDDIDRVWAGHAGPPPTGWLLRPDPANPAIPLAQQLLAAIREAVDM